MDPSLPPVSLRTPPPPALSKRETLSHTAQGELQDASATSREEAQKRKGGTKTARFLLVRSLFGLSWKEKEQLHKTEGMTACVCRRGLGKGVYGGRVGRCKKCKGMLKNWEWSQLGDEMNLGCMIKLCYCVTSSSRRIPDCPHVSRSSSA